MKMAEDFLHPHFTFYPENFNLIDIDQLWKNGTYQRDEFNLIWYSEDGKVINSHFYQLLSKCTTFRIRRITIQWQHYRRAIRYKYFMAREMFALETQNKGQTILPDNDVQVVGNNWRVSFGPYFHFPYVTSWFNSPVQIILHQSSPTTTPDALGVFGHKDLTLDTAQYGFYNIRKLELELREELNLPGSPCNSDPEYSFSTASSRQV